MRRRPEGGGGKGKNRNGAKRKVTCGGKIHEEPGICNNKVHNNKNNNNNSNNNNKTKWSRNRKKSNAWSGHLMGLIVMAVKMWPLEMPTTKGTNKNTSTRAHRQKQNKTIARKFF
ncbi:hypothetical protein, unlikely [Trypanosoma brucei gambiense DAL972]|uniref:Uncharacterized protein n=1 Tax=Trypanosoma brucei gambiense (strain MHOM/CI/86/DAL972) TaxID=679716 RepID=C9ZVW8_TRYB9|nr:hypothetical protein, unlikely [Trypanosoma brucei gambiense DAL972]CBH13556.1 hypothetical protein, unlikely [Trypanosoma brucei gambiense DAL972]|eukprot:XP_011775833.1 hypothetical protein, unlikely [Trypanosoma brucei gambiense DAL972]